MATQQVLNFRTNSKLERLIGRELITNNVIAVFELIKNSYDAGASKVTISFVYFKEYSGTDKKNIIVSNNASHIVIKDDGHGMTFDMVKKYWMEIGTVNKENKKQVSIRNPNIDKMVTRVLNGEKGIGRFGTDKLGSKLHMVSIDDKLQEKTKVYFDWNNYDDYTKLIEQVENRCVVETPKKEEGSGLTLKILKLRDAWTIKDVENLKSQLKKFISPFEQETDDFTIIFKYNEKTEKIVNDSFEYANLYIESSFSIDGELSYEIYDNYLLAKNDIILLEPPIFGPVKLKIYYMDRAAKYAFTKNTGIAFKDYGNIKLFRDNFRILPYGEANNDWLGIDIRHAQAVFRSLGTRDIVGYVQITNLDNRMLKDSTNRLGLVEDSVEFQVFKDYIWKCIEFLQGYIFTKIKDDSYKQGQIVKEKVRDVVESTNVLKEQLLFELKNAPIDKNYFKKIEAVIQVGTKKLQNDFDIVKRANTELEKKIKIFERITGTEGYLYDVLHSIKNKAALIGTQLYGLEKECNRRKININIDLMKMSLNTIDRLASGALNRVTSTKLKKQIYIISDIVRESIEENSHFAEEKHIAIISSFKDNYRRVNCNKESMKIVFDNLFNNSFKALKDATARNIYIETSYQNSFVKILYRDTGNGIADEDIPFIFNVGFSKTNGSGLGLSTSLDILKSHGGDISYIKTENVTEKGARFLITLPVYLEGTKND